MLQKVPSRRGRSSDLQKDVTSTLNAVYVDEAEPFGITSFCNIFSIYSSVYSSPLNPGGKTYSSLNRRWPLHAHRKICSGSKMGKMNLILIIYLFLSVCKCVPQVCRCPWGTAENISSPLSWSYMQL